MLSVTCRMQSMLLSAQCKNSTQNPTTYTPLQPPEHRVTPTVFNNGVPFIHGVQPPHTAPDLLVRASQKLTCGQVNGVLLGRTPCLHGSTVYFFQLHFAGK